MSRPSKITKVEQSAHTRRAILDRARALFAVQGYAATATDDIISGLGITRGALYHQFGDKRGVFRAVIEEVFLEISQYIASQAQKETTSWDQLIHGSYAYLDIAHREDIRRLVFIESPVVLDADTLSQFDRQHGYGLLLGAIAAVVDDGELEIPDLEGFARMINGALDHLATWAAETESAERLKIAKALAERLLTLHRKA